MLSYVSSVSLQLLGFPGISLQILSKRTFLLAQTELHSDMTKLPRELSFGQAEYRISCVRQVLELSECGSPDARFTTTRRIRLLTTK